MKEMEMLPAHVANLMANSSNTTYKVESITYPQMTSDTYI